jgi:hypothetical protein
MQNLVEILLHKCYKKGAFIATQFFTLFLNCFWKKTKNSKKNNKKPKNIFLMYLRCFWRLFQRI